MQKWKNLIKKSIHISNPNAPTIERIDRFAFYERTKSAFAVVMTGETANYGNILLKKGLTPIQLKNTNVFTITLEE